MNKKALAALVGTLAFGTTTVTAFAGEAPAKAEKAEKPAKAEKGEKKDKKDKKDGSCSGAGGCSGKKADEKPPTK